MTRRDRQRLERLEALLGARGARELRASVDAQLEFWEATIPNIEAANPAAVALGRKGGKTSKGVAGREAIAALSPEERSANARKAAAKRWRKSEK